MVANTCQRSVSWQSSTWDSGGVCNIPLQDVPHRADGMQHQVQLALTELMDGLGLHFANLRRDKGLTNPTCTSPTSLRVDWSQALLRYEVRDQLVSTNHQNTTSIPMLIRNCKYASLLQIQSPTFLRVDWSQALLQRIASEQLVSINHQNTTSISMLISNCEPLSLYTYRRSYGKPCWIDQAAEPRTQRQRHCDAHCRNHNSVLFLYVKALSEFLVAPIGTSSGQRFSNLKNIVQTILMENRRDGATRTTSDSPLCYHSERQSKPRAGLPPVATARSKRPAGIN